MCNVCKRSIRKGYPRAVCSNCNKERHRQCTGFRRYEREAISDGDHSWACCGTNVGRSILQWNDIDPLQTKVKDAGIGNGNVMKRSHRTLGGHPVPKAE